MKKFIPIIVGICLYSITTAQMLEKEGSYFRSPVDQPIVLSGSFAELRSTHFHAGIDIKPQSSNGIDTIRAVADGFVSRIKVQTGGYGQVLYIDHPNGYTSVYAHLDKFQDSIASYIHQVQLKSKSYTLDIYPDSTKFFITKGQFIGLMGNTGRSYAKHLHFEIRETKTEIPVNPALFQIKPNDSRPPVLLSLDLHKLSNNYHELYSRTFYPTSISSSEYTINGGKVRFPAYSAGIALQSYDLMNGATNRNGVYYQHLYVDDTLYSSFKMDKVSFDETRYINSHIDYKERKLRNRTLVRSYKLPGNDLEIYNSINNDGIIKLYEKTPRKIRIVLGDIEGNESIVSFLLYRDPEDVIQEPFKFNHLVPVGISDTISICGAEMVFGSESLDRDLYLSCGVDDGIYTLGSHTVKLFQNIKITIPARGIPDSLIKYHSIHYLDDDEWINMGGILENEAIHTYTSDLGKFKLGIDTIAPTINFKLATNILDPGSTIKVIVDDNLKTGGMAQEIKYDVYLDGEWIVAPYKIMTRELTIPLPKSIQIGRHTLEIICKDHHSNRAYKAVEITVR